MTDFANTFKATAQERDVYNLWKNDQNATGINLAFGFRTKNLDVSRLSRAVDEIVLRHGHLRSVFFSEQGVVFRRELSTLSVSVERFPSSNFREFIRAFDLEHGPLVRVAVHKNIVLLDICHIVTDGFSMAIFFSELDSLYSGCTVDYEAQDVPLKSDEIIQNNTMFWAEQFDLPISPILLPFDKAGRGAYGGSGGSLTQKIGGETTRRVRSVCRGLSVTPFIFYFSAFLLFLSREGKSRDVATATNFSCRSSRTMRAIALLAATAPVRFFVDENMTAGDFLHSVERFVKSALLHQSFDMARLLEECGVDDVRDISRTVFTYEHERMANIRLDGEKCEFVPIPSRHSLNDFTLCFFPFRSESRLLLIYRTDLFSPRRARSLLCSYTKIVRQLLSTDTLLGKLLNE